MIEPKRTKLTVKRLNAMNEALGFILAGDLDEAVASKEDFEAAQTWVAEEIERRESRRDNR